MGEAKRRMQASAGDKPHQLGDAPVQSHYRDMMTRVATILDKAFNPETTGTARKTGFVLLVFPFDEPEGFKSGDPRANYVSNAEREDIIVLLKEQLARFQGQPEMKGTA